MTYLRRPEPEPYMLVYKLHWCEEFCTSRASRPATTLVLGKTLAQRSPSPYSPVRHIRSVILIELGIIGVMALVATQFWSYYCTDSFVSCFKDENFTFGNFIFMSLIRPIVFTPAFSFAFVAGGEHGPFIGGFVASISAMLSCLPILAVGKLVGKKIVRPWLYSNLPNTLDFIRSQDWKVVLASRLVFLLPFDLMTILFGFCDFKTRRVLIFTFLGTLPEMFVLAMFGDPEVTAAGSVFTMLSVFCGSLILPGVIIEYYSRQKGAGLWMTAKEAYQELASEIKMNNEIVKRHIHDPKKLPVLLLYGFFSSRKSLLELEAFLTDAGYEVISFNLGGLLGTFFTKGIDETAKFIDFKLKRQFIRHDFDQVQIVAHSKGGIVALWWLLRLGGTEHCKKLISLGTPYRGTKLTWFALGTPVGLFFRDMWQMRPGSSIINELHSLEAPEDLTIYPIYSLNDSVSGDNAILVLDKPHLNTIPIPCHRMPHVLFIHDRGVGELVCELLGSPYRGDVAVDTDLQQVDNAS